MYLAFSFIREFIKKICAPLMDELWIPNPTKEKIVLRIIWNWVYALMIKNREILHNILDNIMISMRIWTTCPVKHTCFSRYHVCLMERLYKCTRLSSPAGSQWSVLLLWHWESLATYHMAGLDYLSVAGWNRSESIFFLKTSDKGCQIKSDIWGQRMTIVFMVSCILTPKISYTSP